MSVAALTQDVIDHIRLSRIDKNKEMELVEIEIKKCQTRISNAKRLIPDETLDTQEYREIKNEYAMQLGKLVG